MDPYIAFDIEIAEIFLEDNPDLNPEDKLGISCAATVTHEGEVKHWYGVQGTSEGTNTFAPRMSQQEAARFTKYLWEAHTAGIPIVTWNGLHFDFHVLAVESGRRKECEEMAWNHVDLCFAVHGIKGYPIGLDAAAKAVGSHKGVEGLEHGRYAPYYWQKGDHFRVLEYVGQDACCTAKVAEYIMEQWGFIWISRAGNPTRLFIPPDMRPETFAGLTPKFIVETWERPDSSWMDSPMPQEYFYSWLSSESPS